MPVPSDHERPADPVAKRRWRTFLAAEAVLMFGWAVGAWAAGTSPGATPVLAAVLSVVGVWVFFSLPVAMLYLLGRPPVMSLSPLWPSPEERAYRREVGSRSVLTDEEFYARFYAGSSIPPHIPAGVRRCLAHLDLLIEQAHPADVIGHAYDDLDWYDVVFRVEKQFGIRFAERDYPLFTGTLGDLIERVHDRLKE